ncbi:AAA family ATPase [Streptomyces sp. SID8361]|uniref:AAA family ATPase n=1 Tax=Streptomyces TaxID=1883 RepID=UPI00081F431C|nr:MULTISPECIES: AAA family ATPase [Streptomyces]MYU16688.1 AAA family ATPase [Streptomyces sp. SID8361]ATL88006.1 AAA ATPase, central domain protein [Streptomyces malaysiensis]MCM3808543.1 AAA family ATPase [Streptomyces sp. DR7-3]MCQ6248706.1 AAA family ATPase [Streptomyces malaysiensis]QDL68656.1 AAA family ATPase [Streptomyces malaysiensis]
MSALPHGVAGVHALPADHHDGPWDAVLIDPAVKERLLATAVLVLRHGRRLAGAAVAPHGLVVLAGPPGTGKSTLAQGLAQAAARVLAPHGATTLVEVDPHAFPSELLGESQRQVSRLFRETLPELAARRPHTVVLVDEVEALAVRRHSASFDTNPVDVHRATDAVLSGLDALRAERPGTLLVVTTNFADAVDDAFLSRADLVIRTEVPGEEVVPEIVADSLRELASQWAELRTLAADASVHRRVGKLLHGLDGRRIRKTVHGALALRVATARDPSLLTADDLVAAAEEAAEALRPAAGPV